MQISTQKQHPSNYLSQKSYNQFFVQQGIIGKKLFVNEFDLTNGKTKELFEGEIPVYLKKHNKLFFYKLGDNQKKWLYYTSFNNGISSKPIKLAPAPPKKRTPNRLFTADTHEPIVPISSDEIIFLNHKDELSVYNLQSNSFREVKVKGFKPLFWRGKNKTLFIKNISSKEVGYIDLLAKNFIKISSLKNAWWFTYDPKNDSIIFSQPTFLVPGAKTYFMNLTSGKRQLLMEKPIVNGTIFRKTNDLL